MLIVDTDILIDAGRNIEQAVDYLERMEHETLLAISAITRMELLVGARNKQEQRHIEQFLTRYVVVKLTEEITDQADVLLLLYRLSHGLAIADSLIAATAIVVTSPLVTKNLRDFGFIKELELAAYP